MQFFRQDTILSIFNSKRNWVESAEIHILAGVLVEVCQAFCANTSFDFGEAIHNLEELLAFDDGDLLGADANQMRGAHATDACA